MTELTLEFRSKFLESCRKLLQQVRPGCKAGLILSGGVDTGAVLTACSELKRSNPELPNIAVAVTVLASEDAPDKLFARKLATVHGIPQIEVKTTPMGLVEDGLGDTIRALKTFDPMTVRNALVIQKAFTTITESLKDQEIDLWLTGDAADELLGGYSFTWQTEDPEWTVKRNQLASNMYFCADDLAEALGLNAKSPFREPEFVDWVTKHCSRSQCIGNSFLVAQVDDIPTERLTGKLILRQAFPENISANRRKDPIEVGSGSSALGGPTFFEKILPVEERDHILKAAKDDKITIPDKDYEKLYYYRAFRATFPNFEGLGKPRFEGKCCNACHFQLYEPSAKFCRGRFVSTLRVDLN